MEGFIGQKRTEFLDAPGSQHRLCNMGVIRVDLEER